MRNCDRTGPSVDAIAKPPWSPKTPIGSSASLVRPRSDGQCLCRRKAPDLMPPQILRRTPGRAWCGCIARRPAQPHLPTLGAEMIMLISVRVLTNDTVVILERGPASLTDTQALAAVMAPMAVIGGEVASTATVTPRNTWAIRVRCAW